MRGLAGIRLDSKYGSQLTSWRVGQRRVASSYFLHASSSKASLEAELESGLTLSALSCTQRQSEWTGKITCYWPCF